MSSTENSGEPGIGGAEAPGIGEYIDHTRVTGETLGATLVDLDFRLVPFAPPPVVVEKDGDRRNEETDLRAKREKVATELTDLRTAAYQRILESGAEVDREGLYILAAEATVAGLPMGRRTASRMHRAARALARLQPNTPVVSLTERAAKGFVAKTARFATPDKGKQLHIQLQIETDKPSKPDEPKPSVTFSAQELFAGYGEEGAPATALSIGHIAIRSAVIRVLRRQLDGPSDAMVLQALLKANLTLGELFIPARSVNRVRRNAFTTATNPEEFSRREEKGKGIVEHGNTPVADAAAWQAALLVDRPAGNDADAIQRHEASVARMLENLFVERVAQLPEGPNMDRLRTVAGHLLKITRKDFSASDVADYAEYLRQRATQGEWKVG